jgi:hypothetical protein
MANTPEKKAVPRKTKPSPTMSPVPEKWTWQQAQDALAKNTTNRHLRDSDVAKYSRLMTDKLWGAKDSKQGFRCSASPLVFDWDENLIDGQHRLHGQVKARTTEYWYVLRDVPPATQQIIDTGLARSAADLLKWAGYGNYTTLQGVARWAWLLEQGQLENGKIKVAIDEIRDMVDRHPDLTHSTEMAIYTRQGFFVRGVIGPTPIGAAHWWIAQHHDHAEADMFIDRMVHVGREKDGSAIQALLQRLASAQKNNEKIRTRVQIAMIVRAWNLDVERTFVHRLPSKSKTGEYPLPEVAKRLISQEDAFGPLTEQEVDSGEYDTYEDDTPDEHHSKAS